jgi:hypothetical protein
MGEGRGFGSWSIFASAGLTFSAGLFSSAFAAGTVSSGLVGVGGSCSGVVDLRLLKCAGSSPSRSDDETLSSGGSATATLESLLSG